MADPILYGPSYSTYTRAARLALEEKGVPYTHVEVDFIGGGGMPEDQVARHPFSKVPAFEHDDLSLYETGAIGRYVDEAFDGPALQPATPAGRARMAQIISITDSYTYAPTVGQLVIQRLVTPMLGGTPDEAAIEAALPQIDQCMGALEAVIGDGPWLAGDGLSLADLHLAPIFAYFTATPESGPILADKPKLRTWWNGIKERPSVVKTEPQMG
jgi:glutathione S-transferase